MDEFVRRTGGTGASLFGARKARKARKPAHAVFNTAVWQGDAWSYPELVDTFKRWISTRRCQDVGERTEVRA